MGPPNFAGLNSFEPTPAKGRRLVFATGRDRPHVCSWGTHGIVEETTLESELLEWEFVNNQGP